jgi:cysteinyl-tRNA synthetase
LLEQGYSPMTVRFFMLQCHYGSTLDFSNDALRAAEKGYTRLMDAIRTLEKAEASDNSTINVDRLRADCQASMDDDFNTPVLISVLFEAAKTANQLQSGQAKATSADLENLKQLFEDYAFEVLGFRKEQSDQSAEVTLTPGLMDLVLKLRKSAKLSKDYATADQIRQQLTALGIEIKDTAEGTDYKIN